MPESDIVNKVGEKGEGRTGRKWSKCSTQQNRTQRKEWKRKYKKKENTGQWIFTVVKAEVNEVGTRKKRHLQRKKAQ